MLSYLKPQKLQLTMSDPTTVEQQMIPKSGNTNSGGELSTVDLLIKVACLIKKENYIFNIKMS